MLSCFVFISEIEREREKELFALFILSSWYHLAFPHGAVVWPVVCNCDISWSY